MLMQNDEGQIPENNTGQVVASISWEASEYVHHDKDFTWTLLLIAAAAFFASLTYFVLQDWFSVVVIVLMAVAVGIYGHRKPRNMTYQITEDGVKIGSRSYQFDNFKSFSVLNEGAVKSIQLEPLKRFIPPMSMFFPPEDEQKIVDMLSNFLPYRKTELDSVDKLFKKLRF